MLDDLPFAIDFGPESPLWALAPWAVPIVVALLLLGCVIRELIWPGD